jgi:putative tricarboxylic transport membrane protein
MRGELIFNFVLMTLLVVLYGVSLSFGGRTVSTDRFGPKGFPQLLIFASLGVLLLLTVPMLKDLRRGKMNLRPTLSSVKKPIVISSLILIGYVFFLDIGGYTLSTLFFVFLVGRAVGYSKNVKLALFTCILTGLLVLVFGTLFSVPLPRGLGIFREMSYLIY